MDRILSARLTRFLLGLLFMIVSLSSNPANLIDNSNSTWIAEEPPCITYGLRGVVHCAVEVVEQSLFRQYPVHLSPTSQISSHKPDVHSGIDGGAVVEPMLDMSAALTL